MTHGKKEDNKMGEKRNIDKETFLSIAKASGLDTEDPSIEDLYTYVESVFPNFKVSEQIDLTNAEPLMVFIPPEE
jgi:Asp-tRNA(Asn)/Glu-tRNA(Gln) amidotransferase C subunit